MLQRRATRLPTRVLVKIRCKRGAFDATIGDLSTGGARLLGVPENRLTVGDLLHVHCGHHAHAAEVRWHFDDTCGLMFVKPLTEQQIAELFAAHSSY